MKSKIAKYTTIILGLLLLVFAYLFIHGFAIYYRIKFDKEM